jgi:hypothetical protein
MVVSQRFCVFFVRNFMKNRRFYEIGFVLQRKTVAVQCQNSTFIPSWMERG